MRRFGWARVREASGACISPQASAGVGGGMRGARRAAGEWLRTWLSAPQSPAHLSLRAARRTGDGAPTGLGSAPMTAADARRPECFINSIAARSSLVDIEHAPPQSPTAGGFSPLRFGSRLRATAECEIQFSEALRLSKQSESERRRAKHSSNSNDTDPDDAARSACGHAATK